MTLYITKLIIYLNPAAWLTPDTPFYLPFGRFFFLAGFMCLLLILFRGRY